MPTASSVFVLFKCVTPLTSSVFALTLTTSCYLCPFLRVIIRSTPSLICSLISACEHVAVICWVSFVRPKILSLVLEAVGGVGSPSVSSAPIPWFVKIPVISLIPLVFLITLINVFSWLFLSRFLTDYAITLTIWEVLRFYWIILEL